MVESAVAPSLQPHELFVNLCHVYDCSSPTANSCIPGDLPRWHNTLLKDLSRPEPERLRRSLTECGDSSLCLRLQREREASIGIACLSGSDLHHDPSVTVTIPRTGRILRRDV